MKKLRIYHFYIIFAIFSACGSMPKTYYYSVENNHQKVNSNRIELPYSLAISRFNADALYEDDRIIYRNAPFQVDFYNYRRWISPPPRMVAENVFQQYEASGLFNHVISMPFAAPFDYILSGKIHTFEELDEGEKWFGIVKIEFTFQNAKTNDVLWQKTISERTEINDKKTIKVVEAISKSLNKVVKESIQQLEEYLKVSSSN